MRIYSEGLGHMGNLAYKANAVDKGQLTGWASHPSTRALLPHQVSKDTLGIALQDGVVRVVGVLHGNSLWELAEHPLLEGLQPLVVMATAHVFFVLSQIGEHTLCLACSPHLHLGVKKLLIPEMSAQSLVAGMGHSTKSLS